MSKSLLGGLCVIGYGFAGLNVVDVAYEVFLIKCTRMSAMLVLYLWVSRLYVFTWGRSVKWLKLPLIWRRCTRVRNYCFASTGPSALLRK